MSEKKRALVVDDQAFNRSFISMYLKTKGYEVQTAEDGLQGLSACKGGTFDLVFSDIEMPNMNGVEFLRSAKKLPGYGPVPFVILSTLEDPALIERLKSMGAFHYMVKPFNDAKMNELFLKLE